MKYLGSKRRIASEILSIILKGRKSDQTYVEPFVGGCNCIERVSGNRIGADENKYLIAMWKALLLGWTPPRQVTVEEYTQIRNDKEKFDPALVGWAGFCVSYSGKFFGGFIGPGLNKGKRVNYQHDARNNIRKQLPSLRGVNFIHADYRELPLPKKSLIYCDPPYQGATGYARPFDHISFWEWVRRSSRKHDIYVSEYHAPSDFKCIWSANVGSNIGGVTRQEKIERLFKFEGTL